MLSEAGDVGKNINANSRDIEYIFFGQICYIIVDSVSSSMVYVYPEFMYTAIDIAALYKLQQICCWIQELG